MGMKAYPRAVPACEFGKVQDCISFACDCKGNSFVMGGVARLPHPGSGRWFCPGPPAADQVLSTLMETNQGVRRETWMGMLLSRARRAASESSSG